MNNYGTVCVLSIQSIVEGGGGGGAEQGKVRRKGDVKGGISSPFNVSVSKLLLAQP